MHLHKTRVFRRDPDGTGVLFKTVAHPAHRLYMGSLVPTLRSRLGATTPPSILSRPRVIHSCAGDYLSTSSNTERFVAEAEDEASSSFLFVTI